MEDIAVNTAPDGYISNSTRATMSHDHTTQLHNHPPSMSEASAHAGTARDKGKNRRLSSDSFGQSEGAQGEPSKTVSDAVTDNNDDDILDDISYGSPRLERHRMSRTESVGSAMEDTAAYSPSLASPLISREGIAIGKARQQGMFHSRRSSSFALQRSAHARSNSSSCGTPSEFDFFSPASNSSTAPTSMTSMSPRSPLQLKGWTFSPVPPEVAASVEGADGAYDTTKATRTSEKVTSVEDSSEESSRGGSAPAISGHHESPTSIAFPQLSPDEANPRAMSPVRARAHSGSLNRQHDTVDDVMDRQRQPYRASLLERAAESDSSRPTTAPTKRVDRFRNVMASKALSSRIVPSRIARRLSTSTDDALDGTGAGPPWQRARSFSRSDSSPDGLVDIGQTAMQQSPSNVATQWEYQLHPWTASSLISGARMGPAPVNARPTTAFITESQLQTGFAFASRNRNRFHSESRQVQSAGVSRAPSRPDSPTLDVTAPRSTGHDYESPTGASTPNRATRAARSLLLGRTDLPIRTLFNPQLEELRARGPASTPSTRPTSPVEYRQADDIDSQAQSRLCPDPRHSSKLRDSEGLVSPTSLARRAPCAFPLPSAALASPTLEEARATAMLPLPLPSPRPQDLFHSMLPRELRLQIMKHLVALHVEAHEKMVREGRFRGERARSAVAVGYTAALAELVKMSRVSKAFLSLAMDGQLWQLVSFPALPELRRRGMLSVAKSAGPFVTCLDLTGMSKLDSDSLDTFTAYLSGQGASSGAGQTTGLTELNLAGLKQIGYKALEDLVDASPSLRKICLKDVPCVAARTCAFIAYRCQRLEELDISRCFKCTGFSLRPMLQDFASWKAKGFKVFKAAGLTRVNADFCRLLAKTMVDLETLDLSYTIISLDCIAALVGHEGPDAQDDSREYFELTAAQASRIGNSQQYRAVWSSLKHLNLSMTGLPEKACSYLAHGFLPSLEVLELAFNGQIRDTGLIALLSGLPSLRRLDLEGLAEISNDVLYALTPISRDPQNSRAPLPAQPGEQLTHLVLSHCRRIESGAMVGLVKGCLKLRRLEADDTQASDSLAIQFVAIMRARQLIDQHLAIHEPESLEPDHDSSNAAKYIATYLSVVDCRLLTRQSCNTLLNAGIVRPRLGQRGAAYNFLEYGDPSEALAFPTTGSIHEQTKRMIEDECNPDRVCVKNFWFWQALDRAERERQKSAKKLAQKTTKKAGLGASALSRALGSSGLGLAIGIGGGGSGSSTPRRLTAEGQEDGTAANGARATAGTLSPAIVRGARGTDVTPTTTANNGQTSIAASNVSAGAMSRIARLASGFLAAAAEEEDTDNDEEQANVNEETTSNDDHAAAPATQPQRAAARRQATAQSSTNFDRDDLLEDGRIVCSIM